MRKIDLPLQIDLLRELAAGFKTLQAKVAALDARPGSELLKELGTTILATHELVGRSLVRLSVLDGSQYTAVPGSRFTMERLSGVIASASVAASQLATAVAGNQREAAGFANGSPTAAVDEVGHAETAPLLAESLSVAATHLDLCYIACRQIASGITRDLKDHPEHRPPLPELTGPQYLALERIAQGGGHRYERRNGTASVQTGDGKPVHATVFGVLQEHHLVRTAGTSAYTGQDVRITAAGRLALEFQKPDPAKAPSLRAVSTPGKESGRTR